MAIEDSKPPTTQTTRLQKAAGSGCVLLFFLPFAAGGLLATGIAGKGLWFWIEAQGWQQAECTIDRTELRESSTDDGVAYRSLADYHYVYEGRTYTGDRVSFDVGSDNVGTFHQDAHAELESHRVGHRPFACFVNPKEPAESVLYRGLRTGKMLFMLLFGLVFNVIGIGGIVLLLRPMSFATGRPASRMIDSD